MENRRVFGIIAAALLLIVSGLAIMDTVSKKCITQNECILLGVSGVGAALGAILLLETYVAHRKAQGTWKRIEKEKTTSKKEISLTSSQIWFRSILRIVLSSVLLGLPIIFQGMFVTTVFGFIAGFSLDALARATTNRIVPAEQGERES